MRLWNLLTELLGFASGILLLLPTLQANNLLRDVLKTLAVFKEPRTEFGKRVAKAADPFLQKSRLPGWTKRDQWVLVLGAALLVVSFTIKFFVVLVSPNS